MTDANKYYLDKREAEQEEYDFKDEYEEIAADNVRLEARAEELEAKLARAMKGLGESQEEIDQYIRQEYPSDHSLHERYRQRDFSANPARTTLAELKGEQDD